MIDIAPPAPEHAGEQTIDWIAHDLKIPDGIVIANALPRSRRDFRYIDGGWQHIGGALVVELYMRDLLSPDSSGSRYLEIYDDHREGLTEDLITVLGKIAQENEANGHTITRQYFGEQPS